MIKKRFLFFPVIILTVCFASSTQLWSRGEGVKYFKNYDTGQHPQNYCITQDKRGVIYAANNAAVLEFDGVSRRDISIPNWTVRSLAADENGIIYVGGINELGYLSPDEKGSLHYVSLADRIKENQKNFGTVWRINAVKEGIYFSTWKYLFRWRPGAGQMSAWETEGDFNDSFICRGTLFIHRRNAGLMEMKRGSPRMLPGGEQFAPVKIYMMAPYGSEQILVGTRSKGFFLYNKQTGTALPFPTTADDYLKENQLCHGIGLASTPGEYALATMAGGLVIIDSSGKIKTTFDKTSGLKSQRAWSVFEDSRGSLWLALDKGIAKIEYASPFSIYDEERWNLTGIVLSVARRGPDGDLYAGTTRGLFRLSSIGGGGFTPVPGIPGNCNFLLSYEGSLLAATSGGIFQVEEKNAAPRRLHRLNTYILYPSRQDGNRVWAGTIEGPVSLRRIKQGAGGYSWQVERRFENIAAVVRTMAEDRQGNLWLGTRAEGVIKVDFPVKGDIAHPVITRFGRAHSLTSNEVRVFRAAGHVLFAAGKSLLRFDEEKRVFVPDATFGPRFTAGKESIFRLMEDSGKHVWIHSEFHNFHAVPRDDGSYSLEAGPFLRIPEVQVNCVYAEPTAHFIYFAANDGLIRFDTRVKKECRFEFNTLVRRVSAGGVILFDGCRPAEKTAAAPEILYRDRNLDFEFSVPVYEAEAEMRYSYFLQGYDRGWSDWVEEPRKFYTNLDPGAYTFRVRGKDVYENRGREGMFRFKILPPWYRTWWAYTFYVLAAGMLVFLFVKWRSRQLVKEKQRLENIVKERTEQVEDKNRQLQDQAEQLREQSGKLAELDRLKSRFFANISHEFRTPLTLIMGPIEQVLAGFPGMGKKEVEKNLHTARRSARRLLSLINQLLDLTRFDSGRMKLRADAHNIVEFLKLVIASFESAAVQRRLDLKLCAEVEDISLYFDPVKMEQIFVNLLANAVKFTPSGGSITVTVLPHVPQSVKIGSKIKEFSTDIFKKGWRKAAQQEFSQVPEPFSKLIPARRRREKYPSGCVEISVKDTGVGIPRDQIAYIFDRFYRVEGARRREQDRKGTGIGLALVKELVRLHHGEIHAHSEGRDSGAEFRLFFPLGKKHLASGEIAASTGNREGDEFSPQNAGDVTGAAGETVAPAEAAALLEEDISAPQEAAAQTGAGSGPGAVEKGKDIILVVDDSAEMREYIRGPLEAHYSVIEAQDGEQGIKAAKESIPDLIISDIMMPGIDGCELCRQLKNDVETSHIPVILLTARAGEESIVNGLKTGADDYITKPFSIHILLARIENLIALRRQLQLKMQRRMTLQPAEIAVSSMDETFLKEMQEQIEKHLSDEDFNVDRLAKNLYMSRANLYRKVLALTGETAVEFIRSYRLKRAAQLLKADFGNVTEVAFAAGFSNTSYFARCFKEKFHVLPSEFHESESS